MFIIISRCYHKLSIVIKFCSYCFFICSCSYWFKITIDTDILHTYSVFYV